MTTTKRIPELDSLRGIAAIAVVLFHYFYNYNKHYQHSFDVPDIFELGQMGVHLFFIISGFVIYWTLTRSRNVVDFAWSRFSRLYPVFWASVAFSFICTSLIGPSDRSVSLSEALINLSMFHEYVGVPHVDGVYWTLSIELAFYLLIGTALFLRITKYTNYICFIWLSLALASRVFDVHLGLLHKALILNWCHLFIAGIMFYQLWAKESDPRAPFFILSLAALVTFMSCSGLKCALALSFFIVFPLAIFGKLRVLNNKIFVWLGTLSYALYLVHQNLGYGIIQIGYSYNINPVLSISLAITASLLAAYLLNIYIEKPSMRYLRSLRKIHMPAKS